MLQIRDLTVAYGHVVALSNVSLEVREKEIVCLLGSNGAGKTTLIRSVMGLKRPEQGQMDYRGEPLHPGDVAARVRRGIAWVPEGRGILTGMSVRDNLLMGGYVLKDKRHLESELAMVLEIFPHLVDRLNQVAGTMSGGEQQMIALGRSLMCRPRIVLMDEPSMGLAPVIVDQVFDVIRKINQRGVAVLLVEQNAHMALSIARRFYILQKGQMGLAGEVQDGRLMARDGAASRQLDESELESAYLGG